MRKSMIRWATVVRQAHAAAFLIGLLVLVVSVFTSALTARDKEEAAQDHALDLALGEQVAAVNNYFGRSRAIAQVLADNPVFADFLQAPGTTREKIAAGGPLLQRVVDALAYLEQLYPGRVVEACFADIDGQQIVRVVDGVPVKPADLRRNEDGSSYFAPTLKLGPQRVYQAKAYESPDTHEPVISNSIVVAASGHAGMVHFEIALDSFRMPATTGGRTASIVDAGTGRVKVDSRAATSASGNDVQTFQPLVKSGDLAGMTTLGDRRVAYQRLPPTQTTANDWYVVVSEPAYGQSWTRGFSVNSIALLLGALLTILISVVSWRGHLRSIRLAASHDPLTGLPNRAEFAERTNAVLRGGRPAVTLIINPRGFRNVNDVLGYQHGDQLLTQVAWRLSEAVPDGATVARIGGADDFAVLLPGAGLAEGRAAAETLLAVLHRTFLIDDLHVDVEANAGLAVAPEHGTDAETLLRHADAALHLAKEQATGVQRYDAANDTNTADRLELLGDLRRAIGADDQLSLQYQPKISLVTGRVTGAEALIRWQHPTRGRTAPDLFIPMAESTSLIRPLTSHVLEMAVCQAKKWADRGTPIPVAVNVSTRCLLDPGFAAQVFGLLYRTGLPASLLRLEITESAAMADPDRALTMLRALHDGGIGLSVDDFGTGHSSMTYLQHLPVDELKIDKSFVQAMTDSHGDAVLVRTAITLAHNLGMSVVAEGVEDDATVAALRELGCDVAQGYRFARPLSTTDFDVWLADFRAGHTVGATPRQI
ncbi:putative bifunctional diguanylate cyclase/phosphodiesterase [Actinoplanes regularis]|uniref:putative bifunctional diguanylate cyclase/phosphodiesterase n=1 Tax=Actinoplanes regularis TaxID=52697 RepID=UPI002555C77E|nr:bifunctional diguanylate cyclase/phosphodiesterase [Actinoplanes regularis]